MTVVDTSVWIEHLKHPDPDLALLLETDQALIHPFVQGELSVGQLRERAKVLAGLSLLPRAPVADDGDVAAMVERFRLWSRGLGWVDCHLLASAREAHAHLLTKDLALKAAWLQVRQK